VKQINPDDDDQDDESALSEADVLELMVNKLARIVQKSMGNKIQDVLDENGGQIDESTSAWLSADYNSGKISIAAVAASAVLESKKFGREEGETEKVNPRINRNSMLITRNALPVSADIIDSFEFDVLRVSGELLEPVVQYMVERYQLPREFGVDPTTLGAFIRRVREGYRSEPRYHSWHHGCDVTHTVYMIMKSTHASEYMTKLELFGCLVAALAHDIGHPGVNNWFLVRTKNELALLHNDASPLENMHAATLYELLRDPALNILAGLDEEQWKTKNIPIVLQK
jgi:hypothetical protein